MGGGGEGYQPKKRKHKNNDIRLFFVLMLYIKFQVPGSSGSLVLTQTKGVAEWFSSVNTNKRSSGRLGA